MRFKKHIAYLSLTIFTICINILSVYAQPGGPDDPSPGTDPLPCDPDDPNCPLDTWVYVLVVIALIYGYRHLQKQKKSLVVN